ncbi:MAG: hypothetical protein COT88_02155 [Candidatus Colwellbacteria bacterium CG10_big_fil_rev_8_21_14_0_10_41_28]|uniref:Small ribosomal subunit protein bS6 n=1 Tax=Candidatus Colwellbacteria bacterium CG10_big_fil_rev_8_21_14_0_10_41_28 TaxID=1974539 RepID=A0A2H0VJ24_9BACT|nr:MAG: hypothetical protein COT88_02155 [Candidatus Colwellbacteria bacterium CG10_big_fil_rev_8_21_14_0_10_41_28]
MEEETTKTYEISFLARGEEGALSMVKHLNSAGAEIINEDKLDQIVLAHPIKKNKTAYFGCIHFSVDTDAIDKIKTALKFEEGILRYLIVTPPFIKTESGQTSTPMNRVERRPAKEAPKSTVSSNKDLEATIEELSESITTD